MNVGKGPGTGSTETTTEAPLFLGYQWIRDALAGYRRNDPRFAALTKRQVVFSVRDFGAALLQLYVGAFPLAELAGLASLRFEELVFLRTQIDFMMLVDALRGSFTTFFRERLLLNDYQLGQYASIASEYALLEEQTRNKIRVPLFHQIKRLADSLEQKERNHLTIDRHDLTAFKRLFSFFALEPYLLPALVYPASEQLRTVARTIVWERLETEAGSLDQILSGALVRQDARQRLQDLLATLVT